VKDYFKGKGEKMIILKRVLKKQDMRMWTGFSWLRIGTGGRML
jgi:hypothetical protein